MISPILTVLGYWKLYQDSHKKTIDKTFSIEMGKFMSFMRGEMNKHISYTQEEWRDEIDRQEELEKLDLTQFGRV